MTWGGASAFLVTDVTSAVAWCSPVTTPSPRRWRVAEGPTCVFLAQASGNPQNPHFCSGRRWAHTCWTGKGVTPRASPALPHGHCRPCRPFAISPRWPSCDSIRTVLLRGGLLCHLTSRCVFVTVIACLSPGRHASGGRDLPPACLSSRFQAGPATGGCSAASGLVPWLPGSLHHNPAFPEGALPCHARSSRANATVLLPEHVFLTSSSRDTVGGEWQWASGVRHASGNEGRPSGPLRDVT